MNDLTCFMLLFAIMQLLACLPASAAQWQSGPGYRFISVESGQERPVLPANKAFRRAAGFTTLPPALTAITFTNRLSVKLLTENRNYMNGAGVAAGDFDDDGWCDLYFCAIDGTNALYRNLGNWRFEDVTAMAGVGCPGLHSTGATFADVNGDGRLDLLVATLGTGVHCFINDGNGHFRETTAEAGLTSRTGSTTLALGDVDGDGTLDLFVANYGAQSILSAGGQVQLVRVNNQWQVTGPYAQRLRFVNGQLEELGEPSVLYLNDGRGHFRPVPWSSEFFLDEEGKPKPAPWDFSLTAQVRDINGDRFPDIYVCNDLQTVDRIWLNDGHGHFRALPRLAMRKQSFSSMGVDFADVDRDGHLDFMVTEMMARDHARRLRQIAGMNALVPMPGRIENRPEVPRNTFYWNRGDNTYAEIANYAGLTASDWSYQPAFLDVDLDGYEDLLIVTGFAYDVQDRDVLAHIRSLGKQTPEQTRTNLLLYPPFLTPNLALRNHHDLTFEDCSAAWGFDARGASHGLAMADLDNDGDLDLAINRLNDGPLVLRNVTTAPRLAVRLQGRPPNGHGIGATVRVWGGPVPMQMQEILCGGRYLSSDDTLRVFAAGSLTNDLTIEVLWRSERNSVVRHARANRLYVIEEPAASQPNPPLLALRAETPPAEPWFKDETSRLNHIHHETLFNDYARQPLLMKLLSQLGPGAAWVDLDGDGHDELVLGTGKGGEIEVFRGNGSGAFQRVTMASQWQAPDDVTGLAPWAAPNGETRLLAGLANYESGATNGPAGVSLGWDKTTGKVSMAELPGVSAWGASPGPLAVADIDGDGRLELFVGGRVIPGAYPQAASSRIFRQQNGNWVPDDVNDPVLADVGLVSGAVWSDLDGDGFPELILACEWGPIRVFKNDHGRLREATDALGLAPLTGWWNSVATGDFDGDGRMDIVAGNWGLNTGYEASSEHPAELYYGRLSGSGQMDLIETEYAPELRAVAPRRTFNALSQAFPALAAHYPSHEAFSTATVADLWPVLQTRPSRVAATTLATTLFLNRGTNFLAIPLPAEAQFAPAFGLCVADFDGDGHEDVFLSQNFFATRPEWPRLDGGRGLVLRGDGQGHLTPVPGQKSGLQIYGEQRGAAVGDFNEDGRPDLVVTQNGTATRLFENRGARPGLRVRLKGLPGNPAGIGAIIRLQFNSGLGPGREIHAGSGYWSQDSLVQILACPTPPANIQVQWPGGRTTTSPIPSGAREVLVDADGKLQVTR